VDSTETEVLVVDDEPMVREVVARYLELDGMRVHQAADGDAAADWLADHRPDLVVLDLMLPGVDGLTILRGLGADDYVVKPFSARELAARVRTVLRRTVARAEPSTDDSPLDFGELFIDLRSREVLVDGAAVALTPKEFDLLAVLARAPRKVFSRRQLLSEVWDSAPEYQDPATVTVHVRRIRQKIERDADEPRWIATSWGVGYRFEP
jgi:DNA-binding response OmpR family regulator